MTGWMKKWFFFVAFAGAVGCAGAGPPRSQGVPGDTWVQLSSTESVLPDLEKQGHAVGCWVKERKWPDNLSHGGMVLQCPQDVIYVAQYNRWLSYRCGYLRGGACEKMMLRLAPQPQG